MSPLEISLAKIRALSSLERKTLLHRGLKLSEEVGELSEALLAIEDAPGMAYKGLNLDNVKEEAIDVILITLSICYMVNMSDGEIAELLMKKCGKWEEKQSK